MSGQGPSFRNRSTTTREPPPPPLAKVSRSKYKVVIIFLIAVSIAAILSSRLLDVYVLQDAGNGTYSAIKAGAELWTSGIQEDDQAKTMNEAEFPLNCSLGQETQVCLGNYYPSKFSAQNGPDHDPSTSTPAPSCPDYFRWIHEDLWPWRETGISEDMVRRAGATANFRLVIVNGTAYVEIYDRPYQTRDRFTLFGILQLLRRYPGQIPDLDLMFDCDDIPVIKKESFRAPGSPAPPPLFRYCRDDASLDIVFPDWSFWGWVEVNIRPWANLSRELKEANERNEWVQRDPHAYWKGNPDVAPTRGDLLKCNVSDQQDWGARLYIQDWNQEIQRGFNHSDLTKQCSHRYKIYIEGTAWSVSEKYILACDSPTLLVMPQFFDFFTRNLMPLRHYWPIKADDKCRFIKCAVEWGNTNQEAAQFIGKEGSSFIQENLKMDHVYDYMFHLLTQYAKLLTFKPSIPPRGVELCSESMACPAPELERKFMTESLVPGPSAGTPCVMPPPYDPATLHSFLQEKENATKLVDEWVKLFWESHK